MKRDAKIPRVVTIGGGHGQAVVLRALRILDCRITAVVATADDGGCSGELRRELGMPAPGDLRRCLSALALDEELAVQLEDRILTSSTVPRCRGNLVIAQRYLQSGSLQQAVDWVAHRIRSVGRVMPVSEDSGTLVVCDRWQGFVEGEDKVENTVASPLVVTVTGATRPNQDAIAAIEEADLVIMGPGSFCTSTLSALLTGGVGAAVCRSHARRLLILNLTNTERPCAEFGERDFITALASHLTICSLGETPELAVLRHASLEGSECLDDGTMVFSADVADDDGVHHGSRRLALALGRIAGIPARARAEVPLLEPSGTDRRLLEQALMRAQEVLDVLSVRR
jgi:uncharacterized cofD-like protein